MIRFSNLAFKLSGDAKECYSGVCGIVTLTLNFVAVPQDVQLSLLLFEVPDMLHLPSILLATLSCIGMSYESTSPSYSVAGAAAVPAAMAPASTPQQHAIVSIYRPAASPQSSGAHALKASGDVFKAARAQHS